MRCPAQIELRQRPSQEGGAFPVVHVKAAEAQPISTARCGWHVRRRRQRPPIARCGCVGFEGGMASGPVRSQMMLADRNDCARLRSLLAFARMETEAYFISHCELVESFVGN